MGQFSPTSLERLSQVHPDLKRLFEEVGKDYDCSILCGHRGEEEQHIAYQSGRSKLDWPESKHNSLPSMAVDAAPYPVDWSDSKRFYLFAGFVLGTAKRMGIDLRWGGDWDRDWDLADNRFNDWPHFELYEA